MHTFPRDWPEAGPIDIEIHDRPHASSTTEWWYINSHFSTSTGKHYSLFASFFRVVLARDETTGEPRYGHALAWALIDPARSTYDPICLLDECAPREGLALLEKGEDIHDPKLRRALTEMLEKNALPLPDRLFSGHAEVATNHLDLKYGENTFRRAPSNTYELTLVNAERNLRCRISFSPLKPAVRHGVAGVVRGVAGEGMFYYFFSRCSISGTLSTGDEVETITGGNCWYDHEFGRHQDRPTHVSFKDRAAWNWISIQLENGYEISAYDLFRVDNMEESYGRWVIVIDPDGTTRSFTNFAFKPVANWTSSRTFNDYPTAWSLTIPDAKIRLEATAAFGDQEFITIISKPAFWEGRVEVAGDVDGHDVRGLGIVERTGFYSDIKIDDFVARVGQLTRGTVEDLLPLEPTGADLMTLIGDDSESRYLDGVDPAQYVETVIQPLREIIDRGGKTWRSYALMASIDVVGGDSRDYVHLLAIPEVLHVGSLIVDDVEDESAIRRGGPACHMLHGTATAINAGNAAYFLFQVLFRKTDLSETQLVRIYELYFRAMRAAHTGQAIDIAGLHAIMPAVADTGEAGDIEQRVLAVHRLKSAVAPSCLAQMGAIIAHGDDAQVSAVGYYFEQIGLAFQIIDDVLNLRGFENESKIRGEDIACGKVTMPVAKAMSVLDRDARMALWQAVSGGTDDPQEIASVVDGLEAAGVLDACVKHAHDLVEDGWQRFDPAVPDSHVKLMIREFGWYVLERYY